MNVGDAEEAVPKRVNHVQNRIDVRHALPKLRQQFNRVKNPAEISQRRENKVWHDGDVIEGAGEYAVQKSAQRKQQRGQHDDARHHRITMRRQLAEQRRHRGHDDADQHAAHHAAADIAQQDDAVGRRRHLQLLDGTLELGAEKRRRHIGVRVGNHRHQNQTRHDEVDVTVALHGTDARPDEVAEDDEIQRGGHHRRQQRLLPDAHEARHFFAHDGGVSGAHGGPVHALPSLTMSRNKRSKRLVLLRMPRAVMLRSASSANT